MNLKQYVSKWSCIRYLLIGFIVAFSVSVSAADELKEHVLDYPEIAIKASTLSQKVALHNLYPLNRGYRGTLDMLSNPEKPTRVAKMNAAAYQRYLNPVANPEKRADFLENVMKQYCQDTGRVIFSTGDTLSTSAIQLPKLDSINTGILAKTAMQRLVLKYAYVLYPDIAKATSRDPKKLTGVHKARLKRLITADYNNDELFARFLDEISQMISTGLQVASKAKYWTARYVFEKSEIASPFVFRTPKTIVKRASPKAVKKEEKPEEEGEGDSKPVVAPKKPEKKALIKKPVAGDPADDEKAPKPEKRELIKKPVPPVDEEEEEETEEEEDEADPEPSERQKPIKKPMLLAGESDEEETEEGEEEGPPPLEPADSDDEAATAAGDPPAEPAAAPMEVESDEASDDEDQTSCWRWMNIGLRNLRNRIRRGYEGL